MRTPSQFPVLELDIPCYGLSCSLHFGSFGTDIISFPRQNTGEISPSVRRSLESSALTQKFHCSQSCSNDFLVQVASGSSTDFTTRLPEGASQLQKLAALEMAQAQILLQRVAAVRKGLLTELDLESPSHEQMRRLAALERYGRRAHRQRRRAADLLQGPEPMG